MAKRPPTKDPVEEEIEMALEIAGVKYERHHPSNLDFYLPTEGIFIECKQFHTPRAIEQMSREADVILVQGKTAARFFTMKLTQSGVLRSMLKEEGNG